METAQERVAKEARAYRAVVDAGVDNPMFTKEMLLERDVQTARAAYEDAGFFTRHRAERHLAKTEQALENHRKIMAVHAPSLESAQRERDKIKAAYEGIQQQLEDFRAKEKTVLAPPEKPLHGYPYLQNEDLRAGNREKVRQKIQDKTTEQTRHRDQARNTATRIQSGDQKTILGFLRQASETMAPRPPKAPDAVRKAGTTKATARAQDTLTAAGRDSLLLRQDKDTRPKMATLERIQKPQARLEESRKQREAFDLRPMVSKRALQQQEAESTKSRQATWMIHHQPAQQQSRGISR